MNNNSKAYQDLFILNVFNYKKNGTFIELGARECPISYGNNTLLLEKEFDWEGISINIAKYNEKTYKYNRPKTLVSIGNEIINIDIEKRLQFQFKELRNIDYLQIESEIIDKTTHDILIQLDNNVFNKYKFGVITFRHDFYRGNYFNTRKLGRDILKKHGYIPVFLDIKLPKDSYVSPKEYIEAEDWFVHPDLVDMDYINKVKSDDSLTFLDIKNILIENMKIKYYLVNASKDDFLNYEKNNTFTNAGININEIITINVPNSDIYFHIMNSEKEIYKIMLSHYGALEHIVNNNYPYAVIMSNEIDHFVNNVPETLKLYLKQLYRNWDILFENDKINYDKEQITDEKLVYRKSIKDDNACRDTKFYFITLSGAKKILKHIVLEKSIDYSFNQVFKKLDMFVYWTEPYNVITKFKQIEMD